MVLNINEIMGILPHRFPMLLVDRVEELNPGESAIGIKNITYNEPCFQGHFPNKPVMPGVFVIEACTQLIHIMLASIPEYNKKSVYYAKIDKANFYRAVIPGDSLRMEVSKQSQVGNLVVCSVNVCGGVEPVFKAYITVMLTD